MNSSTRVSGEGPGYGRFYHGTRIQLGTGDLIEPDHVVITHVHLTPNLDAAIWEAELAAGEGPGRVYVVEPRGPIENASLLPNQKIPGRPWMSWRSQKPLRVAGEVTTWPLYHGTKADLRTGDLIEPGRRSNFTKDGRALRHVYLTRTLEAAKWGAELASGEGPGRIYVVEPIGAIEDDPNLTDKKFRGNPTKSFRSLKPLRVAGEITPWEGHSPDAVKAMKDGLARLDRLGLAIIED